MLLFCSACFISLISQKYNYKYRYLNLKYFIALTATLLVFLKAKSQDTIHVMYYNVLSYTESAFDKTHYFRDIAQYIKPDILVLNEISSDSSCIHVLDSVLNINGDTNYRKAAFTDGPDTDNMLFYNCRKIGMKSQDTIQTDLRIINEYNLFFNDSAFSAQYDSVFFSVYAAHLKASTGSANEQQRLQEAEKFVQHLQNDTDNKNIILGGDLNFYSSTEPALEYLIQPGTYQMYDPLDSIGDWHDNPIYSHTHTQSTRLSAFGGGATGGLDDRFDFIFVSSDLIHGANYAEYIPGTYRAFGNDGHHLNDSLLALPQSNNLPDSITSSLYYMSDHLPVVMKILINYDVSVPEHSNSDTGSLEIFPNPASDKVYIRNPAGIPCQINYNIETAEGKVIACNKIYPNNENIFSINLESLKNGVYYIRIEENHRMYSGKITVAK